MSIFNRHFDVDTVEKMLDSSENAWFRDLLRYWRPAGELQGVLDETQSEHQQARDHLRLAVRDGYLNFYRAGQSLGEVRLTQGFLESRVHNKYVYGDDEGGQDYVKIKGGKFTARDSSLSCYTDNLVHRWILAACNYCGGEKVFVDELVARNANVIDLEAGLPADPKIFHGIKTPRMDLVAIERCGMHWRLAFWEAKLASNGEAKCEGDVPMVIDQLNKYERWIREHRIEVRESYQRSCQALVKFHALAKRLDPRKADLGAAIVAVAGLDPSELWLDCQPRLIIDDRCKSDSFTANGHLKKLRKLGVHIQMVHGVADMALSG